MKSIQILTIASIVVGIISLIVGYFISRPIELDSHKLKVLTINSNKTQKEITSEASIEYLGNWLTLDNSDKYEIHRTNVLKILQKLDEGRVNIKVEHKTHKFFLHPPREIIKFLVNLGP